MMRPTQLVALVLLATLGGCLSIHTHDSAGPYEIHHHTWWNYYRRGRLHLRDQNPEAAEHDFRVALGLEPGARYPYAAERWRARTYGMHTLDGYFPHRELGICLFEQGKLTEALVLLQTSIDMEPSARAKFYINRILEQQAIATAPAPSIEVEHHPAWTSERKVAVRGTARGANAISSISIQGEPEFIELASTNKPFDQNIELVEGRNVIPIEAMDVSGKKTATNWTIIADWTPPQMSISPSDLVCYDDVGLAYVEVNGTVFPNLGRKFELPLSNFQRLDIAAFDRAGNRTDWFVSETVLHHLTQHHLPAPPKLNINGAGQILTLYSPEYALDIRAEDNNALTSVVFNGKDLLKTKTPLFRALERVPLDLGTNLLHVVAEDADGNRSEQTVTVVYRQPEYLDRIYRLVTSMEALTGEVQRESFRNTTVRRLETELTKDPVRFYLLASQEEQGVLSKELDFSEQSLADSRAALQRGHRLDAELAMIPRVLRDGNGHTVYMQVLDVEEGNPLFIEDVYLEKESELPHQIAGLIMKVEQHFPLIQAELQEASGQFKINVGTECGTHKGMRFLVIRSTSRFEDGRIVQAQGRPLEATVSEVEPSSSKVILSTQALKALTPGRTFVFSR